MTKHYRDYFWKEGIPYGIGHIEEPSNENETYKIVMDPYRKHISIEKYIKNCFESIIYDSLFLNFRHLKNEDHRAWKKETVSETPEKVICYLSDQDDRLVFKEIYFFNNDLCTECHVASFHNIPISRQRMYYKTYGDPFDGVILFDQNNHPIVFKKYAFDEELREFTDLIETEWNMQDFKVVELCLK